MKCQILFSGKNIVNLSSAELAERVVKVKSNANAYISTRSACTSFQFDRIFTVHHYIPHYLINPLTSTGLLYHNPLDPSISKKFLLLLFFKEIPVVNANKHFAAADLGLNCLPIILLGLQKPTDLDALFVIKNTYLYQLPG